MSALTHGLHHLGLSVLNVESAATFFQEALGFKKVGEKPYPAIFVSDGNTMLTLWQVRDIDAAQTFDRKNNVGLHHFALRVAPESLDEIYQRLNARDDVRIEFAPEAVGASESKHMMFYTPGGIRIELVAPAS